MVSHDPLPEPQWSALCVSLRILGCSLMVYGSCALMVGHWWPWAVLAFIWGTLFATNMVMTEASLSRYPGWAEYKRRSWWLVPVVG